MLKEKKCLFIFISVIAILGTVSAIYFVQKSKPQNVIESKLKIKLPSNSQIVKYSYNGDYFDTKISIESNNINNVKEQLNIFFGGIYKGKISDAPNFENTCQWWDLDKNNIDMYYFAFVSSEKKLFTSSPKTHEVWAFITKEKNGQYDLYISY